MNRSRIQIYTGVLSTLFFNDTKAFSAPPKPNIVLVLMDDMGYSDVGFMPGSSLDVCTPNIDELARTGTIFTSAYVAHPFCGPSRTSILTGRMSHDIGAQFNLASFSPNGIDTKETFISNVLKNAGYTTGVVGKWHLGEDLQYQPQSRGFDYFYGFLGGGHEYFSDTWISSATYNPANYGIGNYGGDYNRPMMLNAGYVATAKGLYCTDVLTDGAIRFIDNASKETKPFFLYLAYNAPHTPLQAKPADIDALKSKLGNKAAADGSDRLTYTAMMYNADYNIKRMVDKLKTSGLYDNTVIVFLSDNGGKSDKGANNTPLRGDKGDAYEGGFRVPMFVHWPAGNVPQGYVNPYNFSSLDFYPTFAYLAGAEIPADKKPDGKNVWDNIIGKSNPRLDVPLFVMRQHNGNNYTGVVKNNYKLYTSGNGTWLMYDLLADIGETTNIASKNANLVASMKEAVYKWTRTQKRPEFFDDPNYGFEASWNSLNMPNFGKTFGALYNASDYAQPSETAIPVVRSITASVYPNPAQTYITVDFGSAKNKMADIELLDTNGRKVQVVRDLTEQTAGCFTLNINQHLADGWYIWKANAAGESRTGRIMILK